MPKNKGLLDDFDLGDKPDEDTPVQVGDYLEETTTRVGESAPKTPPARPVKKKASAKKPAGKKPAGTAGPSAARTQHESSSGRTRLNITEEKRDQLDEIVREMQRVGPERYLRASEVVDALIAVLHDAREHLDMGMVRRRGKFGSQQHRMYRDALAESIRSTIANHHTD